ncbi:hypothetical protein JAAARDRAFT_37150 [Jaapia argillacea MUCL 33604]|uniref:Uncharacterized protein n=1 Tax=Jaapia argillacea MUCL 33604 TaxID=933084 RepID=A0A067PLF7_9AGAM|nr:hypothetical protein JAAARDRAFT_37150 [Jaapia argillacea MUCL 33604]
MDVSQKLQYIESTEPVVNSSNWSQFPNQSYDEEIVATVQDPAGQSPGCKRSRLEEESDALQSHKRARFLHYAAKASQKLRPIHAAASKLALHIFDHNRKTLVRIDVGKQVLRRHSRKGSTDSGSSTEPEVSSPLNMAEMASGQDEWMEQTLCTPFLERSREVYHLQA